MQVDIDKRRKITRGIFQKIFGSSIKYENVSIFEGFSVGTLFLENGPNDFSETLHDVRYQKVKKSDTAGFFEKKPSRRKIANILKILKIEVFRDFIGNYNRDFVKFASRV